jgi:DNA primase
MAINFEDFVEQVRDANPIEKVLEESGIHLRGHGRLLTSSKHDSMKVRTDMQRVWWYSQNWNGDVFGWIMKEKGCEFMEAVEILARRAHIEMPRLSPVNESEVKRIRATADAFSVAADVFHRWLIGAGDKGEGIQGDKDAMDYACGRGWSQETIRAALVGFSGRKTADQYKDMKGEVSLYGIDPLSPAAVAVLGFEGDVSAWAEKQGLPGIDEDWVYKGRIHGLMDTPGLIYAHKHHGGVKYLSRRNLPGFDKIKSEGKTRDWKSFNPYKLLAGPKQVYWNHAARIDQPLICVEGPGDAISYGQLGFGAMAFCGLLGDVTQVASDEAERMRKMAALINKHQGVYLHFDEDEPGQKAIRLAAKLLGPKVQVMHMFKGRYTREDAEADKKSAEETTDATE